MVSEWKLQRLADQCSVRSSKRIFAREYVETGVPFFKSKDVIDKALGTFSSYDLYISEERYFEIKGKFGSPEKGDLLISSVGNRSGQPYVVQDEGDFYFKDGNILWLSEFDEIDANYLAYWFKSDLGQWTLESVMIGSAQKALTIDAIRNLEIKFPTFPEQKSIAQILGSLDDKIELNRRMNSTLEGMAQALFKSWFVDFEPVIDNALEAGNSIPEELTMRAEIRRKTLADGIANREIANQFPDTFQLTEEMGWIPKGWQERKVNECFQLLGGHSFKSSEYDKDGRFGVVTIKNVQNGKFVEECKDRIEVIPNKMKVHCRLNAGDALLSLTGNVGRVCIVSEGSYVLNQRVSKIVGIDEISKSFSYFFFRQKLFYARMVNIAKGTAQQNLSPLETAKLKQVLPDNNVIRFLSSGFDVNYNKILGNTSENQTLRNLRDTLLPKLISGELRVPEAEKLAEEVL